MRNLSGWKALVALAPSGAFRVIGQGRLDALPLSAVAACQVVAENGEVICDGCTPEHARLIAALPLAYEFLAELARRQPAAIDVLPEIDDAEPTGADVAAAAVTVNEAISSYNEAADELAGAFAPIADYARQVVAYADGLGGGQLLPFTE